jgi:hypothetical protein
LSRGFDPAGCPTKPLVSYQSYRQFPGWILPPLAIRALGAHCINLRSTDHATPTGSTKQALGSAQTNPELIFKSDHQMGANHA